MDVYATSQDLTSWLPTGSTADSATIDRDLRYATIVVARACNRDLYSGETSFVPPLVDATCAQAASWIALGVDPSKLGLDQTIVKKSSILGADVERDTAGQLAAFQEAAGCLCPAAMDILITANLLWQAVPTGATDDCLPHYGLSASRPRISPDTANSIDFWSWDA